MWGEDPGKLLHIYTDGVSMSLYFGWRTRALVSRVGSCPGISHRNRKGSCTEFVATLNLGRLGRNDVYQTLPNPHSEQGHMHRSNGMPTMPVGCGVWAWLTRVERSTCEFACTPAAWQSGNWDVCASSPCGVAADVHDSARNRPSRQSDQHVKRKLEALFALGGKGGCIGWTAGVI